jgi:hypothetical protein
MCRVNILPLPLQLEAAEREKQHMQQRLQQQPQNGISQLKMQELNKQVGVDLVTFVLLHYSRLPLDRLSLYVQCRSGTVSVSVHGCICLAAFVKQ